MALIKCPECKKQVSDKAAFCPLCGYPEPYYAVDTAEEEAADSSEENYDVPEDIVTLAARLLQQETSPEVQKIKLDILRRIATESDIKPARIPAPMNITEIGGYINLMMRLKKEESLQQQTILAQLKDLMQETKSKQIEDLSLKLKLSQQQEKDFSGMLSHSLTSTLGLPMQTPIE